MITLTTILGVLRNGKVTVAGDGQVTTGDMAMKHTARKIRKLHRDTVLAGFAGAVADALALFDKFESQLEQNKGNLRQSAVELTTEWRTDRYLRRLEAQLLVADPTGLLVLSGDGEVIEPDDGVASIGSGSPYAIAAARALLRHTELSSEEIARAAMQIAGDLDIYTNGNIVYYTLAEESKAEVQDTAPENKDS
jgi:ATP-dependent HslUV protease subunit HslV